MLTLMHRIDIPTNKGIENVIVIGIFLNFLNKFINKKVKPKEKTIEKK